MADNDEKLVTEDDRHHVIVRPKAIVGSSGSVWASETIRLRHEDPAAFEVEKTETNAEYSLGFRKCCARLHDDLSLYYDMTESDDLNKITEEHNCKFYAYEKQRAGHLKLRLEKILQLSEVTEMSEHNKSLFACRVIPTIKDILNAIDEVANSDAPVDTAESRVQSVLKVSRPCKQGLEIVSDLCLPPVKPRWADLTDAGPGLAFLTMKFAFATLSWRESTTRIIEYDAIAREVTAGKARPSAQTRLFQTLLLTVQRWNGRSTVDSKISLKTKSKPCLSIPTNSTKKSVWKKMLGTFASRSPKG